jgi:NNP family nitrate/nitrite transporter-like MFS transporter
MIPAIFDRLGSGGRKEAAAVLGFSSAIAAYGSFFIPQGYSLSLTRTGGYTAALVAFLAFYLTCMAVTWWFYLRERGAEQVPARVASEPV